MYSLMQNHNLCNHIYARILNRALSLSFEIAWENVRWTTLGSLNRSSGCLCQSVTVESRVFLLPLRDYVFIKQGKDLSVTESATPQGKWICGIVFFGKRHWDQFVRDGSAQSIILWTELGRTGRSWHFTCAVIKTKKLKTKLHIKGLDQDEKAAVHA